jgi:HSP20 family protein
MPEKQASPFRELFDHFAEMQRMREHFRNPGEPAEVRTHDTAWVPSTDIFAHGDDLVIRCELAGVEPDEVEISLSRGVLWIGGERNPRPDQTGEVSYYTHERRFGPFRRSLTLPESVGRDRLRASMENGLLEILVVGGAAADDHERIEIGRRGERTNVAVDVAPDGGEQ